MTVPPSLPDHLYRFDMGSAEPRGDFKPQRPRDAATLIIIERSGGAARVLMGKRHENHRFMPGKYVFPGGRVDPGDQRIKVDRDFPPLVMDKLMKRMRGRQGPAKARGLALTAIRETLEETGLLIGRKTATPFTTRSPGWRTFMAHGVTPSLDGMMFIARAITPPRRPRRFDTRFFAVDAGAIAERAAFEETDANELLELAWLDFDQARRMDLPIITRVVLDLLEARLGAHDPENPAHPVPFYYLKGRHSMREEL